MNFRVPEVYGKFNSFPKLFFVHFNTRVWSTELLSWSSMDCDPTGDMSLKPTFLVILGLNFNPTNLLLMKNEVELKILIVIN